MWRSWPNEKTDLGLLKIRKQKLPFALGYAVINVVDALGEE